MVDPRLESFAASIVEFVNEPSRKDVRGVVAVDLGLVSDAEAGFRWVLASEFDGLKEQLGIQDGVPSFELFMRWVRSFDPVVSVLLVTLSNEDGTRAYLCRKDRLALGEWVGESLQVFAGTRGASDGKEVDVGVFRDQDTRFARENMSMIRSAASAGFEAFGRGCIVVEWVGGLSDPNVGYNTLEEAVGVAVGVEEKVREMVGAYDPAREVVMLCVRGEGCSAYRLSAVAVGGGSLDVASVPLMYLRNVTRKFPDVVRGVESLRAGGVGWDERVFVPADLVVVFLRDANMPDVGMFLMTHVVTSAVAWRMTKGVYIVEPEVLDVLWRTRFSHELPLSLLSLPEWCPYVSLRREFPHYGLVDGFWVRADQDTFEGVKVPHLSVVLMPGEGNDRDPWAIPVRLGVPIVEGLRRDTSRTSLGGEVRERAVRDFALILERIVAIMLYINARGDVVNRKDPKLQPGNPKPKKTKGGLREFASDQIQYWEVAFRVAKQLRESAVSEGGVSGGDGGEFGRRSPRPHMRRGYFGVRWRGPRTNPEPTIKWIPPTTVNAKSPDELPATVIKLVD
jgi:hypothetical protein